MCHSNAKNNCNQKTTTKLEWWQDPKQRVEVMVGDIIQDGDVWGSGSRLNEYYCQVINTIGEELEPHQGPLYRRVYTEATVTDAGPQVLALLKRNPDLLNMADLIFNTMPATKRIVEDWEINMLKEHIASQSELYVNNRATIMAIYNRLGFDEAAALVASDILR